jgi:glycosyltransferase involved in cell wall biosynthesis
VTPASGTRSPPDELPFREAPGDYLLFLGRITREKRPDLAVEIARRAGVRLKLAARVHPCPYPPARPSRPSGYRADP